MRTIPPVTKNLLIINILMYVATEVLVRTGVDLRDILGLHFFLAPDFKVYQLITYIFMHGDLTHIFFNMFALWMFGCVIERVLGSKKFLIYFLVCGIGAGIIQEAAQFANYSIDNLAAYSTVNYDGEVIAMSDYLNKWTTVGASGAIYGILLAFGMLFPEERIFIFPLPIPIKAKWFVLIYAAIELFFALNQTGDGVAHVAHLGGMFFGFLLIRYWQHHPGSAGFGTGGGRQFFDNMRSSWEKRSHKPAGPSRPADPTPQETDWEYNARKKAEQDEIDRLLDKIRMSGYDSLTDQEKRRLFESGKD